MNLEDIISTLPQETQDTLRLAQIEAEENASVLSASAREKGMPLAVKQGNEVYLNVQFLKATISLLAPKVIMGIHSANDLEKMIVTLGDAARAAELYVEG